MEDMTLEQLVATFGQEVGQQMFDQINASSGGAGAPFSFVKKISDHDSELGKWGEHVVNVKTEKNDAGDRIVTDKGINLGASFDIFIVNIGYQYSRWDDAKERSFTSNSFTDLTTGIATAVDSHSGEPLPESKEDKKAANWRMNKVMGCLVRKDAKSDWIPAIYEVSGKTYFTLGELTNSKSRQGLMDGIYTLKFIKEKKGSTTFIVVDAPKCGYEAINPGEFFGEPIVAGLCGDITKGMTEYRTSQQYKGTTAAPAVGATGGTEGKEDELKW